VSAQPRYQPVIPGTYNGRVTIDGRPAPDGTPISAAIGGVIWAVTATRGGRYVMDIPQALPTSPPWFPKAGTVSFLTGEVRATESAAWNSGLTDLDLAFETGGREVRPLGKSKFTADFLRRVRGLYVDALRRFEQGRFAEVVSAAQEGLELAVKAIFIEAEVEFPKSHRIGEAKFEDRLRALRGGVERWNEPGGWEGTGLARVVFYAGFWAHGYTPAKYGSDTLEASPSELFGRPEATLALWHLAEAVGRLDELSRLK